MYADSFEKELARQLYLRDGSVKLLRPLVLAKQEVALKGQDDLDDLDNIHVKILAHICEHDIAKPDLISISLEINEEDTNQCIRDLFSCEYIDEDQKPTELGKKIIFDIGIQTLALDRYYMNGRLQEVDTLLEDYKENYPDHFNANYPINGRF